ncbi:MAG: sulfatase-like hydrolase/transferase, partial [Acidimicrobiia bacterium]
MSTPTPDLPDIVLVVFDTARRDRFGCYGYERMTTPTVDSLATSGLMAETMITNGPYTLPSHGSLFTGLFPTEHGSQWGTGPQLRESVELTMAEWARDLGYETVCATNNGLISSRTKLSRGFDRYGARLALERGPKRVSRRIKKVLFGGDSGGHIVNDWVRDQLKEVKGPLFLFVNYLECHWAYAPPPRYVRQLGGPKFRFPAGLAYRASTAARVGPWEAIARADPKTLQIYSNLYDAELANADGHLANLLEVLRGAGRLRDGNSIVLVTSDHGEHLG